MFSRGNIFPRVWLCFEPIKKWGGVLSKKIRSTERGGQGSITLKFLDIAIAFGLALVIPLLKLFTRVGSGRLPKSREFLKSHGVWPVTDHYYQPLFNDAHLRKPLTEPRQLPGIDWQHEAQVSLLGSLRYSDEIASLHWSATPQNDLDFNITNGSFESGDADFLYAFIRHFKPKRVFEIGSGQSSKVAHAALARNEQDSGQPFEHVCVEPFEAPWLERLGVKTVRRRVEDVGIDLFSQLEADDLLFIDSSHVIRPQGDVLFEYLELLPTLASGVFVHVHDIFSPRDYSDQLIRERVLMWNEQYLLETLLSNTDRYQVVAALNYLHHSDYLKLKSVCPWLTPDREPGSFYLRVK